MTKEPPNSPAGYGGRQRKLQGNRFVTGRAEFIDDLALDDMVHMSVYRSPHAHARIRVDLARARADPRCLAALDGREASELVDPLPHFVDPGVFGGKSAEVRCLALDKAVYEGQPLACVVAETKGDADALLALIDIESEQLPAVVDSDEAVSEQAPRLYEEWGDNVVIELPFIEGNFAAAADSADHCVEDEFRIQRFSSQPIEPRGYVASFDPRTEAYVLHAATQMPHPLRWAVARALRVPETKVRVIAPNLGGSFGLKCFGQPEEPLVCVMSRIVGRPVKWIEDRSETLLLGAREQVHRFSVAFNSSGEIVGFRDRVVCNVGALSAAPSWVTAFVTGSLFPTGYKIPNSDVTVTAVATNKGPWSAARGFGKEAANLVMERALDLVAHELGLEPAEARRRNLIRSDEFPYRTNGGLNIDSGDYHALIEKALSLLGHVDLREEQDSLRRDGRHMGIGIAFELTPEGADVPGTMVGGYDTSTVRMDPSGGVTVLTGVTTPGGGNETGVAQIVAEELGIDIESVRVVQGDTDVCPFGFGNFSGRGIVLGGSSALLAARDVRQRLERVAAAMLQADSDDLRFGGGVVSVAGSERRVSVRDVAYAVHTLPFAIAAMVEPLLESTRAYKPENISHLPDAKGRIQVFPTYASAVHVAVVEVDVETGKVQIQRLGVVHDCGVIVNPALVEGQVQGAIAMGAGAALMEEQLYDGAGHMRCDRFKTYLMPRASDLPAIEMDHVVTASPFTLLGTKGAGESGIGGALAAIVNAVNDALAPLGARLRRTPASPPNVLAAIDGANYS